MLRPGTKVWVMATVTHHEPYNKATGASGKGLEVLIYDPIEQRSMPAYTSTSRVKPR